MMHQILFWRLNHQDTLWNRWDIWRRISPFFYLHKHTAIFEKNTSSSKVFFDASKHHLAMHGFSRNFRVRSKTSSKTIYWKIRTIEHHFFHILVNFGELPTTILMENIMSCWMNSAIRLGWTDAVCESKDYRNHTSTLFI